MYKFLPELPRVLRYPEDIDLIQGPIIGNDLEWAQSGQPTILGLSDGTTTVSVPWNTGLARFKRLIKNNPNAEWVGHNFVAADLLVLSKLGIDIPLDKCQDTIIWMWLVNPNLAKSSGKQALEEDGDAKRGRGFFNLGTMLSIYTDIWHYKDCRGSGCTGPCPKCDPFAYNGIDSLGPVQALPGLRRQARLRGVDKLYPMHRQLAYDLAQIQEAGVRIDVPYVYPRSKHLLGSTHGRSLDETFLNAKTAIEETFPFNPRSPKAVVEFFVDKYSLKLPDAKEATIAEMVEEMEDGVPVELSALLAFKELGNGCDRWYLPQYRNSAGWLEGYLDPEGYIHPRTAFFTSSTRMMQSGPNMQNVSKRRKLPTGESVGKLVRRAVIAPEGWYIVRADLSNAEGRTILWHAGYKDVPADIHTWMVGNIGLKEDEPFSLALGSARDASKSVTHASNYMEGLQLKDRASLQSPKCKAEIAAGARVVFWDWLFKGKIVTFTGVNLARRAFGDASYENRRRALDVMTRYIDKTFPEIRTFQKRVTKQVEVEHCIRPLHGYVLPSYDARPEDQIKTAVAVWGQQSTAHLNKLAIIDIQRKYREGRPMRVAIPVHDEIVAYCRNDIPPKEAMGWIKESMEIKLEEMPGLVIPADPSYGPNWTEQNK